MLIITNINLKIDYKNLSLISDNDLENYIIFKKERNEIMELKNKLSLIKVEWDNVKKITNPYELIHITNQKKNNNSIALKEPVSRSYFKMIEILNKYKLLYDINEIDTKRYEIQKKEKINILCLAEGPGGFIESILEKKGEDIDLIYGFTLNSNNNKNIPTWSKLINKLEQEKIRVIYGDLYELEDIKILLNNLKDLEIELVTADGGFDYSIDFNLQEQLSYRIIYSEIIIGLKVLKKGGSLVVKIFDIYTVLTIKYIMILKNYFEEVYIDKPLTSRGANSEKYIICKGYKSIEKEIIEILINNIENFNKDIIDINGIELLPEIVKEIEKVNEKYLSSQKEIFEKTLKYINIRPSTKDYIEMIKTQTYNAYEWCINNNIAINKESSYYKKYIDK